MKIGQGILKKLIKLRDNRAITGGEFKPYSKYLEPMLYSGGLKRRGVTRSRFEIILSDIESFNLYIKNRFNITDLDGYLQNLQNPKTTRAEMLEVSLDDKAKRVNPFDGLYLASYDNIEVSIDGNITRLNTLNGCLLFVNRNSNLQISKDILVIGVENTENLLFIKKQIDYFSHLKEKKIFVYRNSSMLNWIEEIANNYLHYGDFDFAGISIYKSQILPRVRANRRFFIPSNIKEMLKRGQSDLYYKHFAYKEGILGIDESLDELILLIDDYKKTVRQEFLINFKSS